jgi:general L-amino acid transport system ATP-binding protein
MDQGEIVEQAGPDAFFNAPVSDRCRTFLSQILQH